MNTPQTPIFDKGAILFGLDRAAEHIRRADVAVIVEGYMDVIAAHQHDNQNVVASMGTALTERQLGLLRRLTENIVLAFDPDTRADRRPASAATSWLSAWECRSAS